MYITTNTDHQARRFSRPQDARARPLTNKMIAAFGATRVAMPLPARGRGGLQRRGRWLCAALGGDPCGEAARDDQFPRRPTSRSPPVSALFIVAMNPAKYEKPAGGPEEGHRRQLGRRLLGLDRQGLISPPRPRAEGGRAWQPVRHHPGRRADQVAQDHRQAGRELGQGDGRQGLPGRPCSTPPRR